MLKKKEYIKPNSFTVSIDLTEHLLDDSGSGGSYTPTPGGDGDLVKGESEVTSNFNVWDEAW